MKLAEIKEPIKGKWKIGNLNGVFKNFKSEESPEARKWMRNRGDADQVWDGVNWGPDLKKQDREDRKAEREERKREKEREANNPWAPKKVTSDELRKLYIDATEAAASSFPDGDPIDHLHRFLDSRNWDTSHIDMAFKKFGHGREKKGWNQYLIDMWDDMAGDRIADAKSELAAGREPEHSPFYDVEDGKVIPADNPWK